MRKVLITGGSGFIGTHYVDVLLEQNVDLINIDIQPPKKKEHDKYWVSANILDISVLQEIFQKFQPTQVVHLAARTAVDGSSLDDFRDNTIGTANVLDAIKITPGISRVVVTSSQHVRKPGSGLPKNDLDFLPHGLYGESKVITEILTRNAGLPCTWTIIRPTTIWGPWHPVLPYGLWKLMRKGLYFHPHHDPIIRSYGYVKNVTWQIEKLLSTAEQNVNERVFYVGDESIRQLQWVNAFSRALIGRDVLQVPRQLIHLLALVGDILGYAGIRFPMDSARYFNLTTMNLVSLASTNQTFGLPPYTLETGIDETVQWITENL